MHVTTRNGGGSKIENPPDSIHQSWKCSEKH